eukprot:1015490-Karenia_brevis.AAC.1
MYDIDANSDRTCLFAIAPRIDSEVLKFPVVRKSNKGWQPRDKFEKQEINILLRQQLGPPSSATVNM